MDNGIILREGTLSQLLEGHRTLDDLFVSLTGRKIDE
jgi:hypothetical protein